jgi:hypothetical protein
MCATLWSWINLGLIDKNRLSIVHVKRNLSDATKSGMKDHIIPSYCDGTENGVRRMLARYVELAQWHVNTLKVPTFTLEFEKLLDDPMNVIIKLADFVGIENQNKIKAAYKLVGKRRAFYRYLLHRYFVHMPEMLIRRLTRNNTIH